MLIKVTSVENKFVKRFLQHCAYLAIVFVLIPFFLYFEVVIVFPTIFEEWSVAHIIHLMIAAFVLLNIIGNLLYGMFSDTSIKGRILNGRSSDKANWTFCSVCECMRPPRSWHCDICDVCVLKRDHHCTFFACCVGYYNQRYFLCFVLYIFLSMVYAFCLNIKYLGTFMSWNYGIVIVQFIFPLVNLVLNFSSEFIYIILLDINFVVAVFSGYLFYFHLNNILNGRTTPELKLDKGISYDQGWKSNLIEVLGCRWYFTWLFPFLHSPLPGDGLEWNFKDTLKNE